MPCRIQPWVKPSCCTWELSLCPDLSPCLSSSRCALLQARFFPPPTSLSALPELYLKYWEVLLGGIFLAWFRKSALALSFLVCVFLICAWLVKAQTRALKASLINLNAVVKEGVNRGRYFTWYIRGVPCVCLNKKQQNRKLLKYVVILNSRWGMQ